MQYIKGRRFPEDKLPMESEVRQRTSDSIEIRRNLSPFAGIRFGLRLHQNTIV
jgi:hypothetical protein